MIHVLDHILLAILQIPFFLWLGRVENVAYHSFSKETVSLP